MTSPPVPYPNVASGISSTNVRTHRRGSSERAGGMHVWHMYIDRMYRCLLDPWGTAVLRPGACWVCTYSNPRSVVFLLPPPLHKHQCRPFPRALVGSSHAKSGWLADVGSWLPSPGPGQPGSDMRTDGRTDGRGYACRAASGFARVASQQPAMYVCRPCSHATCMCIW
jgi:hypothetical protein